MALWQFLNADGDNVGDPFDDGLTARPGEPGFTTSLADAEAAKRGDGVTPSYIGTPNWVPPADETDDS